MSVLTLDYCHLRAEPLCVGSRNLRVAEAVHMQVSKRLGTSLGMHPCGLCRMGNHVDARVGRAWRGITKVRGGIGAPQDRSWHLSEARPEEQPHVGREPFPGLRGQLIIKARVPRPKFCARR